MWQLQGHTAWSQVEFDIDKSLLKYLYNQLTKSIMLYEIKVMVIL